MKPMRLLLNPQSSRYHAYKTSLSAWLGEQPYAALAQTKETLYFTDFADHSWHGPSADFAARRPATVEAFDAEFHHKPEAELRIEASTDNLSCVAAAQNIAQFAQRDDVGEVWLVIVLRDPIARIVSEYEHTLRMGWQSGSLMQSLKAEPERTAQNYHPLFRHLDRSSYATQIARYKALFGRVSQSLAPRCAAMDHRRAGGALHPNRRRDRFHAQRLARRDRRLHGRP